MATLLILDGIFIETDIQAATCGQLDKKKEQIITYNRQQIEANYLFLSETSTISDERDTSEDMEDTDVVSGGSVTSDGAVNGNEKGDTAVTTELPGMVERPEVTRLPEPTKVPAGSTTSTPMETQNAEPTFAPAVTEQAEATQDPLATSVPVVSKEPIVSQRPIATIKPEKTRVPIITPTIRPFPVVPTGSAVATSKPTDSSTENTNTVAPLATLAPDNSAVEEVVYCAVHYQLNGGTNAEGNPSRVYASGASYRLKEPKKKGYAFEGWYLESSFKHRVYYVEPNGVNSITYYAKWKVVTVQKVKIISAKRLKNGKIRVKVGNNTGADGYEYVYSLTPSMAKKSLVRSVKNPKDLTRLKKKAKYYIKVRCYKYDSWGRKVYGSYSKVVKCK